MTPCILLSVIFFLLNFGSSQGQGNCSADRCSTGVFQIKKNYSDSTIPVVVGAKSKSSPPFQFVANYVINLDQRADRLQSFKQRFHSQALLFHRFSAVDGATLHNSGSIDLSIVDHDYNGSKWQSVADAGRRSLSHPQEVAFSTNETYSQSLSSGEIGRIYSHVRLWRKIADTKSTNDFQFHCIFEDDAVLVDDFKTRRAEMVDRLPRDQPIDILYLGHRNAHEEGTKWRTTDSFRSRIVHGTYGYCVSKRGVNKLLAKLPVRNSLDVWMSLQFRDMDVHVARRMLVSGDHNGGNNIMDSSSKSEQHLQNESAEANGVSPTFSYKIVQNYVLNLDSRPDRMTFSKNRWEEQKILIQRVSAFDGSRLTGGDSKGNIPMNKLDLSIVYPVYDNTEMAKRHDPNMKSGQVYMSAGEIGVIYSHVSLWKKIAANADSDLDDYHYSCIFEDQYAPVIDFKRKRSQVLDDLSLDEPVDVLYLVYKNGDERGTMSTSNYTISSGLFWLCSGYCLSANGARKLLSELPVDRGLDVWMSDQFSFLRIRAATPILCNISIPHLATDGVPIVIHSNVSWTTNDTYEDLFDPWFHPDLSKFSPCAHGSNLSCNYEQEKFFPTAKKFHVGSQHSGVAKFFDVWCNPDGLIVNTKTCFAVQNTGCLIGGTSENVFDPSGARSYDVVVSIAGRVGAWHAHVVLDILVGLAHIEPFLFRTAYIHVQKASDFVIQWLSIAGVSADRVIDGTVYARTLFAPKLGGCNVASPYQISWLASQVRQSLRLTERSQQSLILVKRSFKRQLQNFDDLQHAVQLYADAHDLDLLIFDDGNLPDVRSQLILFASAKIVVAPHGAALMNLIASPVGTEVLEISDIIFNPNHQTRDSFPRFCAVLGHVYRAIPSKRFVVDALALQASLHSSSHPGVSPNVYIQKIQDTRNARAALQTLDWYGFSNAKMNLCRACSGSCAACDAAFLDLPSSVRTCVANITKSEFDEEILLSP